MDERIGNTIKTYDFTAGTYSEETDKLLQKEKLEKFTKLVKPCGYILDLGCGPGRDAEYFYNLGFKVTGLDLSMELLSIAEKRVPTEVFLKQDITKGMDTRLTPIYSGAWASASYVHVPRDRIENSFQQINKLLLPNGAFYVSVMEGENSEVRASKRYGDAPGKGEKFWQYYPAEELRAILTNANFEIVDFSRTENKFSANHPWIDFIARKI